MAVYNKKVRAFVSRYTVLLLKCRVLLRHVDSTRITTVHYRSVPVIMTAVLPVMLAGQPLIPSLEMERLKVHSIYGRTKNLLRRLYLMGLIEGCKMFQETVGLTMWQMGLN